MSPAGFGLFAQSVDPGRGGVKDGTPLPEGNGGRLGKAEVLEPVVPVALPDDTETDGAADELLEEDEDDEAPPPDEGGAPPPAGVEAGGPPPCEPLFPWAHAPPAASIVAISKAIHLDMAFSSKNELSD